VLGPQGRRGEVLADLHTDFPERFAERRELSGLGANGERRPLMLEEHWFHKGGVVLKFAGVDSISDAEQLAGWEVQIPREQRAELEEGAAYVSELVGCEVFVGDGSQLLGTVADVDFGGGAAPLLVVRREDVRSGEIRGEGKQEYLLPYAEEFLRAVDFERRRIEMTMPEGLLELQAPLNSDEKQQQKQEAAEAKAAGERKKRRG
jgi:16S rRNA processing protein RimM